MPRIKHLIDGEMVAKLAERQWPVTEIAAFFGCHRATLERRYAADIERGRLRGCARIRDAQWQRLKDKSDTVLLFMSKHYLGQGSEENAASAVTINITPQEKLEPLFRDIEAAVKERLEWEQTPSSQLLSPSSPSPSPGESTENGLLTSEKTS